MAYNKLIVFLKSEDVADNVGNVDCVWREVTKAWANVNCTGGREFYEAIQTNTQNYMTFRCRWSKTLSCLDTVKTHIVYNNRVYNVVHIDDYMEQHRELVIKAEEVI